MKYTINNELPDHPKTTWPVLVLIYVDKWQSVFKVLQWIHDRRLDFILSPDTEFGQGWKFEVQFPGGAFVDYDSLTKYAEELKNNG